MADRKPLAVLGALAAAATALFVLGAAGAGRGPDGGGLPAWASPEASRGDRLTVADLEGSPSCAFDGGAISFVGACTVTVRAVTEGPAWERVTRRAILTAGPRSVQLTVTLAGRTLRTDLDPGDGVRLTYTRDGGTFVLGCADVGGCVVVLSEDG